MIYHSGDRKALRADNDFCAEELKLRHESAKAVNYLCYFIPVRNLLISPHTGSGIYHFGLYFFEFIIQHILFLKAVCLSLSIGTKRLGFILVKHEKSISDYRIVTEFIEYYQIQNSIVHNLRSYHFFLDYDGSPVTFKLGLQSAFAELFPVKEKAFLSVFDCAGRNSVCRCCSDSLFFLD